jgi:hypothetical protein
MVHFSATSPAHARRLRHPSQLSDARLDALAREWTAQDRARLKAQRATTPRLSRTRIWQTIQEEFAQWAQSRPSLRADAPLFPSPLPQTDHA